MGQQFMSACFLFPPPTSSFIPRTSLGTSIHHLSIEHTHQYDLVRVMGFETRRDL